ncbi:MAG: hypothetical protein JW730_10760 [Anaerolineales bacterium]|nr:hypothetical protein [Anaerolineales bacterium]
MKWIFTDAAQAEAGPAEPLIATPDGELEVLYDLALRGDMRHIQERVILLAQRDEKYRPFAAKVRRLAEGFETKAVLDLVKYAMEEHE